MRSYRQFLGLDTNVEFEDLGPWEGRDLLCTFFEQATKRNGDLYPSGLIMNLYCAYNRILRRRQKLQIMETGVQEAPFWMGEDAWFQKVGLACVLSMRRSGEAGIGTERKQVSGQLFVFDCIGFILL
jgi:hypothetical protein